MTGIGIRKSFRSFSRGSGAPEGCESLPHLIAKQKWEQVIALLSEKQVLEFLRSPVTEGGSQKETGESILHLSCRFHPKFQAVRLLYEAHPPALLVADKMGRYPLHLAAKCGASPAVIEYLLNRNAAAASSQDVTGKTPLHLACEDYALAFEPADDKWSDPDAVKHNTLAVIESLCKAAPEAVNLEDADGMSALEYAIASGNPLKVVKKLQKASEKDWKRRTNQGEGHSDVKQGLQDELKQRNERVQKEVVMAMKVATTALSLSSGKETDEKQGAAKIPSMPRLPMLSGRRKKKSTRALTA